MHRPLASVLIPTYNRHDELLQLLCDLSKQDSDAFDVVVVDDASVPPLAETLAEADFPFAFHLLRNDINRGIGFSRNRCIDLAEGEYLLWIDSDSRVPDKGWVTWHINQHDKASSRVVHSEVQGITSNYAGRTFYYSNWFGSCGSVAKRAKDHHVPTNNTSLPRKLFELVGRFDESLRAAEDVDWSLRALAAGIELWYVPGMPVHHRDRDSLRAVWASYRNIGKYAQMVRLKDRSSPYHWLYPKSIVLAPLYVLFITSLLSLYILWTWLPLDRRVLCYFPGIVLANVAYALGVVDALKEGNN